jgi:NAD(P)-dependent dehydrogenase (short-subunit alcohol dehydrogenase family)
LDDVVDYIESRFGGLDLLVKDAGIFLIGSVEVITLKNW